LRDEIGAELDERDYAKEPLMRAELVDLFRGRDPRDFINPKSPAFKSLELKGKSLTEAQAISLIAKEPNLLKRPLTIVGRKLIGGFDREELRKAFG
jgi:arsenate reductase-like glutaredoxin family protein